MGNEYDFQKKFANMGIDKESILSIHKEEKTQQTAAPSSSSSPAPQKVEQASDSQELMLLKRKVEYITNNLLARIDERFTEMEKKIEEKTGTVVEYNRDITLIRNDVADLKKKMLNIRISFDDDFRPATTSKHSAPAPSHPQPVAQNTSPSGEQRQAPTQGSARPGTGANTQNIKVEDYFNFSNKKF
jgi:hypothetical protein